MTANWISSHVISWMPNFGKRIILLFFFCTWSLQPCWTGSVLCPKPFMPLIIVICFVFIFSILFLGAAISFRTPAQQDFSLIIFILNVFTIALVHCAGNVVNTYFDYVKGIDNRKSDDRTLVDHILTIDEVRKDLLMCQRLSLIQMFIFRSSR